MLQYYENNEKIRNPAIQIKYVYIKLRWNTFPISSPWTHQTDKVNISLLCYSALKLASSHLRKEFRRLSKPEILFVSFAAKNFEISIAKAKGGSTLYYMFISNVCCYVLNMFILCNVNMYITVDKRPHSLCSYK